jgi:AcrR family transcriptional regulator
MKIPMSTRPDLQREPAPRATKRTSAGERTRESILRTVISLAATEGLTGVSIGRLADELGMSKSGLFRHFGSKEDLEIASIDTASAAFVEKVIRPALLVERGAPRLWALFMAWLAHARAPSLISSCFFASVASEFGSRPGRVRDRIARVMSDWVAVLETAAEQAKEVGHLRPDVDVPQLVFELHSFAEGANAWNILHGDPTIFARGVGAASARLQAAATASCPAFPLPESVDAKPAARAYPKSAAAAPAARKATSGPARRSPR